MTEQTRSDQLRQALERFSKRLSLIMEVSPVDGDDLRVEYLASIGLRIMEGDQQLVERAAVAIRDVDYGKTQIPDDSIAEETFTIYYIRAARAVLAAITEGSGE